MKLLPGYPELEDAAGLVPGLNATVGEIVTPWRLSEYIDQLEAAISDLNVQVNSGTVSQKFDYVGWWAFFVQWEQYRAELGIVDEWVNPGETFNRVEQYHNDYITWRKRAAANGIVPPNSDPMPKPQPYQKDAPGFTSTLTDVLTDVAVIGGLAVTVYFINSVRSR